MKRMIATQKLLEKALLILTDSADINQRQHIAYHQYLCHIKADSIPHFIRKDYYHLLNLLDAMLAEECSNNIDRELPPEPEQDITSNMLATVILGFLLRLNQWIAIENYLTSQRPVVI